MPTVRALLAALALCSLPAGTANAFERDRDGQGTEIDALTVGASLRWKFY